MTNDELADLLELTAKGLREHRPLNGSTTEPETRLCVSAEEGARMLDISKRTFERLKLKSIKINGNTRYRVQTIKDFLDDREAITEAGL